MTIFSDRSDKQLQNFKELLIYALGVVELEIQKGNMLWPELPHPRDLGAWLRKMEANPGSCVILTIEPPALGKTRPAVRVAWISEAERKKIRKSLIEVNISRGLRNEPMLTDPP